MVLSGNEVLVLGLGVSGFAAAELAAQQGAHVTVLDSGGSEALAERGEQLAQRGIDVLLEWNDPDWSRVADLAIISPGIPAESVLGQLCDRLTCPVVSELEYGYRHCSCPVLAVSGTNGKTTTVELLTHCLRHAGWSVMAGGNIGRPLSALARSSAGLDYLVVEVSSFQLERISDFAPLAAVLLNVTPDHLDRYSGFDAYFDTKLKVFANMRRACRTVLHAELGRQDAVTAALPGDGTAPLCFCAEDSLQADYFLTDDGRLCGRTATGVQTFACQSELRIRGKHNTENALAALALAQAAGIAPERLAPHLGTFVPGPHRLELAAFRDGVRYINDSKATNPDAMARGILCSAAETPGRILLMAGGVDKGVDLGCAEPLLAKRVAEVFLIGRCRERLAQQWGRVVSCKMFVSLAAAFDAAADSARPGDTVLFSPGCASFDMFSDYAERGREFCSLVKRRTGE